MNDTRRLNAILWSGNALLIIGIVAFAFQVLASTDLRSRDSVGPGSLPIRVQAPESMETGSLSALPNPLLHSKERPEDDPSGVTIRLIGTLRILDDPAGITAYLEIPARKLNVNAYLAEPVRDAMGRELTELSGWLLKKVTPKSAVFTTPNGEVTLHLEEITASSASSKAGPSRDASRATSQDDVRTVLNEAADLYKQGRLAESCVKFEEAFRMKPSADTVYALMMRVGADVVASMMTSKDEKIRSLGYRLFEWAKRSHERMRAGKAIGHPPPSRDLQITRKSNL